MAESSSLPGHKPAGASATDPGEVHQPVELRRARVAHQLDSHPAGGATVRLLASARPVAARPVVRAVGVDHLVVALARRRAVGAGLEAMHPRGEPMPCACSAPSRPRRFLSRVTHCHTGTVRPAWLRALGDYPGRARGGVHRAAATICRGSIRRLAVRCWMIKRSARARRDLSRNLACGLAAFLVSARLRSGSRPGRRADA